MEPNTRPGPRPSSVTETAREQIREELRLERRSRMYRAILLLVLYAALVAGFTLMIGPRPWSWAALGYLAVGWGVASSWLVVSLFTGIEAGWAWREGLVVATIAAPFIRSVPFLKVTLPGLSPPDYKCAVVILALGSIALLLGVIVLGDKRRRFGGASLLFAATCAAVGAVAVGLRCLTGDVLHNLSHAAATAAVLAITFLATGVHWRSSRS